jgi:glycosyltransferase involved in cell wall biosynthesis
MRLVKRLYRLALRRPRKVFFQNDEDRDLFIREGLVRCELTEVLPGSGVDVERFRPGPRRPPSERFVFLLVARLLRDKGVFEYVEAARQLRMELPCAEFRLMGFLDARNPTAVRREEVLSWEDEGVIRYLGTSDDVRSQYADADCVVLPSYREGTPRTLLEAASMGLPVIAADAVGCRQAVQDGVTGYLCRVRDSADLAEKMRRIVSLTADERIQMGLAGRNKILREFDERIVTARYLDEIKEVMTRLNSGNYCPRASEDAALPRT